MAKVSLSGRVLAVATDIVAENLRTLLATQSLNRPARKLLRGEIQKLQSIADEGCRIAIKAR
jgi:hypothetical protein